MRRSLLNPTFPDLILQQKEEELNQFINHFYSE